jgi:two-component system sensor histidine kinase KdpD
VLTFSIGRPEDLLMLATYFCIAFVTGVLTTRARAQEKAVRMREERAVALYTLTRDLTAAMSKDEVARCVVANVRRFFDADVVICLGQADGDIFTAAHPDSTLQIDEKEFAVAAWVYWNEKKAGKFTDTLPSSSATYFPLSGPRYPLGVIGVRLHQESPLSLDQETLLENFLRQISMAIERETLNEMTKQAIVIEESERLYKTLFNSISHEMRTPISAIISASESLQDGRLSHTGGVQTELSAQIHEAADRLNRLVENLLDMTRLESGLIQPKLDWCDVNDLINTTTRKLSNELTRHRVEVDISPEIDLVKMDFALMEQVLTNLLLNATHYTPAGSEIRVGCTRDGNDCIITVADNGPGLPKGSEEKLFEKFYRLPGAPPGGTGLGLSIAKGFVEAHKGTIKAERRTEGGTRFTIRIPLESLPARGTEG